MTKSINKHALCFCKIKYDYAEWFNSLSKAVPITINFYIVWSLNGELSDYNYAEADLRGAGGLIKGITEA